MTQKKARCLRLICIVVAVLSAGTGLLTLFFGVACELQGLFVSVHDGYLAATVPSRGGFECVALSSHLPRGRALRWLPTLSWRKASERTYVFTNLPLWIPAFVADCAAAYFHRKARPARPRVCPKCAYDLTSNESGVCPECGTPIPPTRNEDKNS